MNEEIPTIEPYRELWKREEQDNKELREEIQRLHSIIKEVRELLNKSNISVIEYTGHEDYEYDYITDKVIEILDKENKENGRK